MFKTVEIEINENCNMSCSYCPNSNSQRLEKGEMNDEVFDELLRQLKAIGFKDNISLHFYGEPLISPNLEKRIISIREKLPLSNIVIYSNGTMLTKKKLTSLVEYGMNLIVVTKHRDSFDREYIFDEVFENLEDEFKKYVKFQSFDQIKLTNRGGAVEIKDTFPHITAPCYIPTSMLVITLKGNVLPCFEDYFQKYQMGNIMQNNILDIWESEKYSSFRRDLRLGLRSKFDICKVCNRTEVLSELEV